MLFVWLNLFVHLFMHATQIRVQRYSFFSIYATFCRFFFIFPIFFVSLHPKIIAKYVEYPFFP